MNLIYYFVVKIAAKTKNGDEKPPVRVTLLIPEIQFYNEDSISLVRIGNILNDWVCTPSQGYFLSRIISKSYLVPAPKKCSNNVDSWAECKRDRL